VDKRTFIKSVFLGGAGLVISSQAYKIKASVNKKKWDGKFILPELGFAYSALEPHMNAHTLRLHHQEHAAYTEKFNAEVNKAGLKGKTAFEILSDASKYSETICQTGGGYLNHKLFWKMLTPPGKQYPSGELINAFTRDFGSFDAFRDKFTQAALSCHSEGWAWLTCSGKQLKISCTSGNDSPVMDTAPVQGAPILCLDLWKHAYEDSYKDDKSAYIQSFWEVANWDFVSLRYSRNLRKETRDPGRGTSRRYSR
jgi:superoxide dismutase, Fe-Mn family